MRAYCEERKNGVDAERFIAFYDSKGWMIGRNRMKNWKMAVVTWEKRQEDDRRGGVGNAASGGDDRKYDPQEYWGNAGGGGDVRWEGW